MRVPVNADLWEQCLQLGVLDVIGHWFSCEFRCSDVADLESPSRSRSVAEPFQWTRHRVNQMRIDMTNYPIQLDHS
jgi:hypothetical protein